MRLVLAITPATSNILAAYGVVTKYTKYVLIVFLVT